MISEAIEFVRRWAHLIVTAGTTAILWSVAVALTAGFDGFGAVLYLAGLFMIGAITGWAAGER